MEKFISCIQVLLLLAIIIPSQPENISWITTYNYLQPDIIFFMWSTHSPRLDCHNILTSFNIIASIARECGSCPSTSNHTAVTCTDVPTNGGMCTFAVQSMLCGSMIGGPSRPVSFDTVTSNKNSKKIIVYYVDLL